MLAPKTASGLFSFFSNSAFCHTNSLDSGGFGPGYKVAGGYSFVTDAGALANSSDPLTTCYGTRDYYAGGHGTHVAGS